LNESHSTALQIIPLGGLGEIGMNLMVYGYAGKFLVVDCGLAFPNPDTPGVDLIIPDTRFLAENRDHIVGFVMTHGHEDHIGALPYIWPDLEGPVYGTAMTLGLLKNKFREHNLHMRVPCVQVNYRQAFQLGPFSIRFIQVTHSIVDSAAVAITTPLGTILHTGDFKIDHTPIGGRATDLHSLANLGEQGVLALLSDSTNINRPGVTISEQALSTVFDKIFPMARGLLVVATFSSNIERVQQIIDAAIRVGRKVVLNGRSMVANVAVARGLGYLTIPSESLLDLREMGRYPREELLVISTGSQGEPNSSLVRIASGDHREIVLREGDMVVLSSKFIPGNERTIWTMINHFVGIGVHVVHEKNHAEIHVSGHAPREDLKLMLALIRPRFFIPIHGEVRHLRSHCQLAIQMGVAPERSVMMENGDLALLEQESLRIVDKVPNGRVFVDGKGVGDVEDIVLRDRLHLAEDGLVVVVLVVDKASNSVIQRPELLTRGVIHEDNNQELLSEAKDAVEKALLLGPKALDFADEEGAGHREVAQRALRRFFKRRLGRRPAVIPLVMEM
jgi:ribonuclease J